MCTQSAAAGDSVPPGGAHRRIDRAVRRWSGREVRATGVGGGMSSALFDELDNHGCAPTGPLLTASECAAFAAMWDDDQRFRSTIDMERYRFGRGVYRYFDNPLPPKVA